MPAGTAAGTAGGPELTVMTRNLYLGTGLDNTVTATTPGALVAAATQDWLNVVANDFPTRTRALAEEIVQAQPDVLALQEVSLWRDQTPSDIVTGDTTANAGHVVYDFLAILQAELAARDVPYVVESIPFNADAEAPRLDPSSANGLTDVRLTDRDALLVRAPLAGSSPIRTTGATPRSSAVATPEVNVRPKDGPSFGCGWRPALNGPAGSVLKTYTNLSGSSWARGDAVSSAARRKLLHRPVPRAPRRALAFLHRHEGARDVRIPHEDSQEPDCRLTGTTSGARISSARLERGGSR